MQQRTRLIPLVLSLSLILTGLTACSEGEGAQREAASASSLEEGQYEIYGKIRSANGNEIVLAVGTLAQGFGQGGPGDGLAGGETAGSGAPMPEGSFPNEDAPSNADDARPARSQDGEGGPPSRGEGGDRIMGEEHFERAQAAPASAGGPGQGEPPQSVDLPGGGQRAGRVGGSFSGGLSLEYTGEEITCLIPVTATISTGMGENARSVRFTQLAAKNIVRLVLDETDTIVSVQVLG